mmetsp:Transcript_26020/g.36995  ORF Transcript_26020/g.36995 Transcript_26020/m.36995 type:complete len:126 (+) Transcript_26020:306-683(+)
MNDAKEGDTLCCRVASHHGSTRCHSRVCDMAYKDILDLNITCNMKRPTQIEAMVDEEDHEGLAAISQYCIPSFFRDFKFCDPTHGYMLHMFQLGVVKAAIKIFWIVLPLHKKQYWMTWVVGSTID